MTICRHGYSTLVRDILHQLEADILSGALMPGQHLDEQRLAARFGASRTPVREALRHLTAAGLVEGRPRRGMVVAEISIPRMIQMFEVMAVLEGLCARLAARRMSAEEREQLRTLHGDAGCLLGNASNSQSYHNIGTEFHDVIYACTRNPFLEETTRNLRARVSAYRRHQLTLPGRVAKSHEEHDGILKAILEGNADLAEDMMRQHINIQGDMFVDYMTALTTSQVMAGS